MQKFDVLNQYQTLALTNQIISRKIVATTAKHLMKYVLRTCIYRSMIMAVTTKNAQWKNFNKKKKSMTITVMTVYLQIFGAPSLER